MHQATLTLLGALIAASPVLAASPFGTLNGTVRVLVVSAPTATNPSLAQQNQWLAAGVAGLRDRDVVVIRMVGKAVDAPRNLKLDAQEARRALGLPTAQFGVALIGRDRSEVFHQTVPIEIQSLFQIIDAMPMRQQEMRQHKP